MNSKNTHMNKNGLMARGEEHRTAEWKTARDGIVRSIHDFLDEAERRAESGEPLGTHGNIHSGSGIKRTVIQDPFGTPTEHTGPMLFESQINLQAEQLQPAGAYFNKAEDGTRELVVIDNKEVVTIADNPLEQLVAGPDAGYDVGKRTILASFEVVNIKDGSYFGARIDAAGDVMASRFEGETHRRTSLDNDPEQLHAVHALLGETQSSLLTEV